MVSMTDYTENELWLILRQERARLTQRRTEIAHQQRVLGESMQKIDDRLAELDTAEGILEGGL